MKLSKCQNWFRSDEMPFITLANVDKNSWRHMASLSWWDAISQTANEISRGTTALRDDVIKWKHFPRYWPFVWGIHRSPLNSPHKGQWRGALMLSLICTWTNGWVNNRDAGDFRRHRAYYDVTLMSRGNNRWDRSILKCYQSCQWVKIHQYLLVDLRFTINTKG